MTKSSSPSTSRSAPSHPARPRSSTTATLWLAAAGSLRFTESLFRIIVADFRVPSSRTKRGTPGSAHDGYLRGVAQGVRQLESLPRSPEERVAGDESAADELAGELAEKRSDSRNPAPDSFSRFSRRAVQSQSPQAQGSAPFSSRHLCRSCASCTRVRSKYFSQ